MIGVVIVTFNSAHVVKDAIAPLINESSARIVVVDNASEDNTVELLRAKFPLVTVISSTENMGFARAVNIGWREFGSDVDSVLLLNPDAVVDSRTVLELARRLTADDTISIVAPDIEQPTGTLQTLEAGRAPTLWRVFTHYSGLSRLADRVPGLEGQFLLRRHVSESRDVDWVTGAVLMTRRETLEQMQGLTERWFMYAEDIEFCYRVNRSGSRIRWMSDLTATHVMGGSSTSLPKRVNTAPFTTLADFYGTSIAPTLLHAALWRLVVGAGLASRSVAFRVMSKRGNVERRRDLRVRSYKFARYAQGVLSFKS